MFKTMLIGTIVLACASMAAAQANDYKRFEFFGGYSYNRIDFGVRGGDFTDRQEGIHGFNTSVTGNISRRVGLKFDFSGHFKTKHTPFVGSATVNTDSHVYNFLGGVQFKNTSTENTFKPFAHVLVGAAYARNRIDFSQDVCAAVVSIPIPCPVPFTESDTGLAGAFGAGIDIRASNRVDIRIIQYDLNPTRLFDSTQLNYRIGVGIVIH